MWSQRRAEYLWYGFGFCVAYFVLINTTLPTITLHQYGQITDTRDEPVNSLIFTGDLMLARDVETRINLFGETYPYQSVTEFLKKQQYVVSNFEATIPEIHLPTPNHTFRFSVDSKRLEGLAASGVSHLSLANNHSGDFGEPGRLHTKAALINAGLQAFGAPAADSIDISRITFKGKQIALIALNAVGTEIDKEQLATTLKTETDISDQLIVTVHWGTEYQTQHNQAQEKLAHWLVDNGADLIIGHHPHVVQDIEIYNQTPIFYSLGNFIFDQYFSPEVQTGLLIALEGADLETITLHPVSSLGSLASPRLLTGAEKEVFLAKLAARSDVGIQTAILAGEITLQPSLAISP